MDSHPWRSSLGPPVVETEIRDEPATLAVVDAVAAVAGVRALELPPLHDSVDADALDELCQSETNPGTVSFEYADFLVVITTDGVVEVYDPGGDGGPSADGSDGSGDATGAGP